MLVYAVLAHQRSAYGGGLAGHRPGNKNARRILRGAMPAGSSLFSFQRNDYLHYQLGGNSRLYPGKMDGKRLLDHWQKRSQRRIRRGYENLACGVKSMDRVLAFGFHPEILDLTAAFRAIMMLPAAEEMYIW